MHQPIFGLRLESLQDSLSIVHMMRTCGYYRLILKVVKAIWACTILDIHSQVHLLTLMLPLLKLAMQHFVAQKCAKKEI